MRLTTLAAALFFSTLTGCGTTIQNDVPCPAFPVLHTVTPELAAQTPRDVIEIVSMNYIYLYRHIEKLEARAGCGDP